MGVKSIVNEPSAAECAQTKLPGIQLAREELQVDAGEDGLARVVCLPQPANAHRGFP